MKRPRKFASDSTLIREVEGQLAAARRELGEKLSSLDAAGVMAREQFIGELERRLSAIRKPRAAERYEERGMLAFKFR